MASTFTMVKLSISNLVSNFAEKRDENYYVNYIAMNLSDTFFKDGSK